MMNQNPNSTALPPSHNTRGKARWKLFAILGVCAAPLLLSYFTYYVIQPKSRTNYGDLIDPRSHPMPVLTTQSLEGKPEALQNLKGKWLMVQVDASACSLACERKLFDMRQLRVAQGKEMERIERVWLVTDKALVSPDLQTAIKGTHVWRADAMELKTWLPSEVKTSIHDHIYLIDPLGNLMMRFPKDADPNKVKKDITKLLKASSIG